MPRYRGNKRFHEFLLIKGCWGANQVWSSTGLKSDSWRTSWTILPPIGICPAKLDKQPRYSHIRYLNPLLKSEVAIASLFCQTKQPKTFILQVVLEQTPRLKSLKFCTTSMFEKVPRIHETYLLDQQLFCWRHFSKTEVVQNNDLNILAL
jgi:hypothetical protein